MFHTYYAVLLFAITPVLVWGAVMAWRRKQAPGASAFVLATAGNLWWTLCYALHLSNAAQPAPYFWLKLMFVGVVVIPAAFFVFVLQYTNRKNWVSRRIIVLLFIEPIILNLGLWTNPLHGLFTGDPAGISNIFVGGVLFWLHSAYSYLLITVSGGILLWHTLTARSLFRRQSFLIIVAMVIPAAANIVTIFKLTPWPATDFSTLGLSFAGIILAYAIFYQHLFELIPVARDAIIEEMSDGLLVINLETRIVDLNPAAEAILGVQRPSVLGMPIDQVIKFWHQIASCLARDAEFDEEILLAERVPRYLNIRVRPLCDAHDQKSGWFLMIQDITGRKEAEDKLAEHRSRLEAIFSSVKDAIITVDPKLRIIEANKSTQVICGIAMREATGREFTACQTTCSRSCNEVLRQTLEKKSVIKEYRIECEHTQRPHQVVSVSSSPLLDPDNNFMGVVLVIRDVTLLRNVERELRERNQFQNIIGRNKTMQDIYSLLEDLTNLDTTVLVTGESGTGKELVARALHYSGNRAFKPFITVSCSALAESLLESELFGHVKGAFTGAIKDKQGRFQAADRGTILLDEVGDISPLIQLKLLRVLQEKEFERVGESTPQKVDVRVIASTNKDLKEKVKLGEFRQDLYYRLKVVEVALPPLRERLEDLPLLVDHFLRSFNERFDKSVEEISNEVLNTFMNYSWPGNVRELEHVMEHAFVLCHGLTITMHHLPADMRHYRQIGATPPSSNQQVETLTGREDILDALNKTGGNKAKAARLLGISRQTIYRKINDH